MTLYYTTSAGENEEQYLPQNSLGGYKSSTPVKNDDFDNIFGEISVMTINQNRDNYIALVLENETGADITNVEVWFETNEGCYSTFQVAAVDMVADKNGILKMERTRGMHNRPFNGTFVDADIDTKALVGDLAEGERVGIWLKRSLNIEVIDLDQSTLYELDPANRHVYRKVELGTEDTMTFHISWD
jgi:hypothetical protein